MSELYRAATERFALIGEEMQDDIRPLAAGATFHQDRDHHWELGLRQATLRVGGIERTAVRPWKGWELPAFQGVRDSTFAPGQ